MTSTAPTFTLLTLDQVVDADRLVSANPLRFDMTGREVKGVQAILRRVLYRWCSQAGAFKWAPGNGLRRPLIDLDAATFSRADIRGYQTALEREALDEDYVVAARVTCSLVSDTFYVKAILKLTNGNSYALEVSVTQAAAVLAAIGNQV